MQPQPHPHPQQPPFHHHDHLPMPAPFPAPQHQQQHQQHHHHHEQPRMPVWAAREVALAVAARPKKQLMTHANFVGHVRPQHACHAPDTVWRIVPGLADPTGVSIQSTGQWHNHFLRHSSMAARLDPFDSAELFRKDATFALRPALSGLGGVSFESLNFPNHFLVMEHDQLVLRQYHDDASFFERATWKLKDPHRHT